MTDERDMTAGDECGPGFPGIFGRRHWRGEQPKGKSSEHESLHMSRLRPFGAAVACSTQ